MKKSIIVFLGLCFLMGIPNTSSAQLKKFIQKKKDKLAKMAGKPTSAEKAERLPKETDGITSDIHKKYMNQIVFSNEAIKLKEEDESKFISTYKITDPLWFRIYMDNSLMNYMLEAPEGKDISPRYLESYSTYKITFYLNDKEILSALDESIPFNPDLIYGQTSFKGAFSCKEVGVFYFAENEFRQFLIEAEPLLTQGTHDFKMTVEPIYNYKGYKKDDVVKFLIDKKFTGELKLVVDGSIVDKSEPKICLPNPVIQDPKLEATLLKTFNADLPNIETVDKVIIIQNKWFIIQNKYTGFPERKYTTATVPFRRDGKCWRRNYHFIRDFDGIEYGSLYLETASTEKVIPCACLEE